VASTFAAVTVGLDAVGALHARELPQKDNLCGCFWASIALEAAGVESPDGEPLDQDRIAVESGTILPRGDPSGFVPPRESSRQDYRLELPVAVDPATHTGTASPSLAAAIERLSAGRLAALPVVGPWSAGTVVRLVEVVAAASPSALLLANIRTGPLWGTRPGPAVLVEYLAGGDPEPPEADWDVGHFVNVAGVVTASERALVVVRDSYRSLGWHGHHLQPADAFAGALARGDGREGGVLCISPSLEEAALREYLARGGFNLRHWDNGTPGR
jgi:hypothetical protein